MSPVGAFLDNRNRRTLRAEPNPLDKCTVVSIYPRDIHEVKPTIQPGYFHIKAGSYENPSILVVGPSSWWREVDESQPLLEITNSSIQIADSIVNDYCNGILASNMVDSKPGLYYIPGELTPLDIKSKTPNPQLKGGSNWNLLERARIQQLKWFENLVRLGNQLWARSNGNPLTINDDMRLAANQLGRKDIDWLKDFNTVELSKCPACGALRNPEYPVCNSCHMIVDKAKAEKLGISAAVMK